MKPHRSEIAVRCVREGFGCLVLIGLVLISAAAVGAAIGLAIVAGTAVFGAFGGCAPDRVETGLTGCEATVGALTSCGIEVDAESCFGPGEDGLWDCLGLAATRFLVADDPDCTDLAAEAAECRIEAEPEWSGGEDVPDIPPEAAICPRIDENDMEATTLALKSIVDCGASWAL